MAVSTPILGVSAPTGVLLRARLYLPGTDTAAADAAMAEAPAGSGQYSARPSVSGLADDASGPYEYEVRQVATQDGTGYDGSITIRRTRGAYGWLVGGAWYDSRSVDAAAGGGTGTVPVDHDTGGTDNLRYVVPGGGSGVDGGAVRAYLKSDYDAGTYAERGRSTTGADGRWLTPIYLTTGLVFTFTFSKPGVYAVSTKEQLV
jgi:hypothetical protein